MGKNIVLLSDGTGNAAAKIWRSNVWRFFQSLDLTNSEQVACYDDGVGTSAFKPLALLGGAFGWGLKRNVLDLYTFLCRNYEEGCKIYLLGFSRGAFTVRIVAGLIVNQGIVKTESESERRRLAKAAYRAYRRERYHTILGIERLFRGLRDLILAIKDRGKRYTKDNNIPPPDIRFIGVWDTVAAYGLPVEEMTRGVSLWLWPLELPDRVLSNKVKRACHALALDDERTTFHPVLWTEADENPAQSAADGKRYTKDERISQVWFAGVHSNVGGGYPDDSLAYVAQYWMMKEAQQCGIRFKKTPDADPDALRSAISSRDKDGRLYDSRNGLGGYYRYGPRKIAQLSNMRFSRAADDAVKIESPKIHQSVFERGLNGAHVYAPIGLPARYDIVTDEGEIQDANRNPYEAPAHAARRSDGQEHVWNLVWWRRVTYFLTVAASGYLLLFPMIYRTDREAEFQTPFRMVSEAVRLAGGFLPGFFSWWLNSYATNPGWFVIAAFLVGAFIWLGATLGVAVNDRMRQIWRAPVRDIPSLPKGGIYAIRTNWLYQGLLRLMKRQIVPLISVIGILYLVTAIGSHVLFNIGDAAGAYCQESESAKAVPLREEVTAQTAFRANDLCWASGIKLVKGHRYEITIVRTSSEWRDGSPFGGIGYNTGLGGFAASELPSFGDRVAMSLGVPLRRVFLRPWFRIVGRVGAVGTDEYFLDPDETSDPMEPQSTKLSVAFRTRRGGELFLYVNEAVIGWPRFADLFYRKNQGEALVRVRHLAAR